MHRSPPAIEQNNRTGGISYWEADLNQSISDARGISLADYIHAIFSFLRQAKVKSVLMIGCGGGTLATMLRRAGVSVVIVDIDPLSFGIARRYFHMPADVECHVADGAAFLRRETRRFDAIVMDAYGEAAIPPHLLRQSFFAAVKARLKPRNAMFLVNILVKDDNDRTPDRICGRLRRTWRHVRLVDSENFDDRNAVALAGSVLGLKKPRLLMPPRPGARKMAADLAPMAFRDIRP